MADAAASPVTNGEQDAMQSVKDVHAEPEGALSLAMAEASEAFSVTGEGSGGKAGDQAGSASPGVAERVARCARRCAMWVTASVSPEVWLTKKASAKKSDGELPWLPATVGPDFSYCISSSSRVNLRRGER